MLLITVALWQWKPLPSCSQFMPTPWGFQGKWFAITCLCLGTLDVLGDFPYKKGDPGLFLRFVIVELAWSI